MYELFPQLPVFWQLPVLRKLPAHSKSQMPEIPILGMVGGGSPGNIIPWGMPVPLANKSGM